MLGVLLHKEGIRYEMLSEHNLFGAVRCVSEAFTSNEPMSRHLGITVSDFATFAQAYYSELIDEGLSLVAVDEQQNRVIGVRMSEDYCKQDEDIYIVGLSPRFFPLFALLESLSMEFKKIRRVEPGKYAHMFMVAVAQGYNGRGIAPNMYRLFLKLVMEKGFTHAVTEPTGVISQHILINKFGFRELFRINYRDFEFEGTYPFSDLKGHECAMLLEKELAELRGLFEMN